MAASRVRSGGASARLRPLLLGLALGAAPLVLSTARADDVAEATASFQVGNEHFQRAMRSRGARRTEELEQALSAYFASLEHVRSRNVVYNTALVLEQLERHTEAFNYWLEYLAVDGLSDAERADGEQHREALRARVALVRVTSAPDADVWIDRRDLGLRGHTPLELAVSPGEHVVLLRAPSFRDAQVAAAAVVGQVATVRVTLSAEPIAVRVVAPPESSVAIDDSPLPAGSVASLAPGSHIARLTTGGRTIEHTFDVAPGATNVVVDLSALRPPVDRVTPIVVRSSVPALVTVDATSHGQGTEVRVEASPGPHRVMVTAEGRRPWRGSLTLADAPLELDVSLATPADGWIYAGRATFGALALTALSFGIGMLVDASAKRDDNASTPNDATASALADATLRVDVSWSIFAATGGLAVLFLALDPGGGESHAEISVAPMLGGAALTLRGSWGGPS